MAKIRVGALTVEQRDALLQDLLRRIGHIESGFQAGHGQQNVHHYVKNVSGEVIPGFACMQVTGTAEIGNQNFLEVDKPADEDSENGHYIFNGYEDIAVGGLGIAYDGPLVRVLSDVASPSAGDELGPQTGSWNVKAGGTLLIAAGGDDVRTDVVKAFLQGGGGSAGCDFIFGTVVSQGTDGEGNYLMVTPGYAPCTCSTVPGIDEYGQIEVRDKCGLILPDDIDYTGDKVFAKYMQPIDGSYGDCEWLLVVVCCGLEMVNVGTCLSLGSSVEDPYSEENCLILDRVKIPLPCPQPTTDCEICGPEPCPEVDCTLLEDYDDDYSPGL